ncbi:hypothetical protein SDRG_13193 [Saprolegnia diclina VS20]|uniref:Uncharacterized protein n=1 Tax=Saprolegnia diclina (strain VS20) TaxID=1156394 RepID=T0RGX2_SAPDV|nr:hypothetical protein SDRG_13193 [Saprolegnia diclina VS20]EQC29037.1 hypothetical protein SDRG_13193 [Saprolegnia diclina VS20]|eukprot:XP_008617496.1 hypothetical protein SDRG_13193 [Saprolegnia diclina VS20]
MYNSTSILMDYITEIDPPMLQRSMAIMRCKARRLCTLQWFFMSHLTTFGLPEKELRHKKQIAPVHNPTNTTTLLSPSHTADDHGQSASDRFASSIEKPNSEDRHLVVQDKGHHIHLLDADLNDVKTLMFNIKILKNTDVSIY